MFLYSIWSIYSLFLFNLVTLLKFKFLLNIFCLELQLL